MINQVPSTFWLTYATLEQPSGHAVKLYPKGGTLLVGTGLIVCVSGDGGSRL